MTRIKFEVTGYVQGVGFRRFVEREALRIGNISGFVYNTIHGSVQGEAQAHPMKIQELISALHHGSRYSSVAKVDHQPIELKNDEAGFAILRR
ncbi:Acylphosphatase-like domain-containing protein [Lipomyces oligophaga]|uniref:Acylphosphatase-like domain-containing protein n=1 Tax=Lipomyces oligophaga TaxID=45792 RepID=UPI0034CDC57F